MEVSANVRRTEPTPRREQDGETYSAATRSRSTSTQPIGAPSTATHTSCSRIARATRSAAPRVAHLSACSLDIAGTASARMARRRILASASSSAASARRICIKSLPGTPNVRVDRSWRANASRPSGRTRGSALYAASRFAYHTAGFSRNSQDTCCVLILTNLVRDHLPDRFALGGRGLGQQ